jgi:rRNA-processing protein FCF1
MDLARGTLLRIMPQFVIEREIQGAGSLSEAQIREVSLRSLETLKEMGPQIQWLHSYVTEDKVYCVYLAPDENSIREHARRAGIPADRVSAVRRLIDPANLK